MSYWTRERVEALPPSVGTEVARELLARAEAAEAVIAEVRRWAQSGLAEVERLRALLRQGMDEQARRQTRVVAPGHTDLMVSPEAIDMYLAEERVDALDRLLHTMVDGACTECGLWEPMPYGLECPARLRAALDASPSQADVDELTETVTAERRVVDHYARLLDEARAEVERLRGVVDEWEADMHLRIRTGYDTTVAETWRAHCAGIEVARDEAVAEVERLRALRAERKAATAETLRVMRAEVEAVHAERDQARAEVERLRVLLRRLQWGGGDYCPLCGGCRYAHHRGAADYGHAHDCEIAAALEVIDG